MLDTTVCKQTQTANLGYEPAYEHNSERKDIQQEKIVNITLLQR